MAVHFFMPAQQEAWGHINKVLCAKRAGYSPEFLEDMWDAGLLGVHEMATDTGSFGYLVLAKFDLGLGPFLSVMWCQVRPCKALREDLDWLESAVPYLRAVAASQSCKEIRIGVADDHPSPSWRWRLQRHGFKPLMTELGISVASQEN